LIRHSKDTVICTIKRLLAYLCMVIQQKILLSKSTFIRSLQCEKSLFLYKYHYDQRDVIPASRQAIFRRGTDIGILAQKLFPGGVDASPPKYNDYQVAVDTTARLIIEGVKIIYEAAFCFNDVYAAIDILVNENGIWKAYEVKSSTSVSDTYLLDASLQYHVLKSSGIDLKDIYVVIINNQYVRSGKVELHKLFRPVSVLNEAVKNEGKIKKGIKKALEILNLQVVPEKKIGEHCSIPYTCDFMGTCWKDVPKPSVFDLAGMHLYKKFKFYNEGKIKPEDLNPDELSEVQRVQLRGIIEKTIQINKPEIKKFLKKAKYPLLFMDFETIMPAIPLWDNSRPYQQIPFQFSVHYRQNEQSELQHFEFLAEAGLDPRKYFLEELIKIASQPGTILVYNASFELTRMRELAHMFPQFEAQVLDMASRTLDLMEPFRKLHYYVPEMNGSHSIKQVLPALVAELNYNDLVIGNGQLATNAFEALQTETDILKIAETREQLLEYCKLDTLAMVKILEKLEEVVKEI
jgi:hypothetical protein